jgi:hypothetical protein
MARLIIFFRSRLASVSVAAEIQANDVSAGMEANPTRQKEADNRGEATAQQR